MLACRDCNAAKADMPFLAFLLAATADPRWRPGIPTLLDFRDLDLTALSPTEVQELAELHRPHAEMLRHTRIAVLVTRSVDYGIVRMWEAFTDDLGLAHAPFYELETAEAWLAEG